jgi:hypothetical protein
MASSIIFKHLLDILKVESQLDGEGSSEISAEWLPSILSSCVALRDSALNRSATSTKDLLTILPKVIKCYSRLLNRAVSIPLSQIKNHHLVEALCEGISSILNILNTSEYSIKTAVQKIAIDEQASLVMVFLHLITIFEIIQLKSTKAEDGHVENEHISEIALQLYNHILVATFQITNDVPVFHSALGDHKLNVVFSGHLSTQLIQSLLSFCAHKSKRIASLASTDLLYTLRCFQQHTSVWRTCFPGVFSGLFVLTQSGYKR